jgi:hypothetical protein
MPPTGDIVMVISTLYVESGTGFTEAINNNHQQAACWAEQHKDTVGDPSEFTREL